MDLKIVNLMRIDSHIPKFSKVNKISTEGVIPLYLFFERDVN
jgi:hypothetical protein